MSGSKVGPLTIVVVAISLLFAACGSDDSSDTTATASGGDATATTSAAAGVTSSPIVAELQKALQTLGYHPGAVDGFYGPHTIDAVKEFQTDAGITVDGKYGPQTHKALEEAIAGSDFNWDEYAAVEEMQIEMADLGYYTGSIDGVYGPETEAAVKAVQADCNITQDGIYGPTHTRACSISAETHRSDNATLSSDESSHRSVRVRCRLPGRVMRPAAWRSSVRRFCWSG